jgi:hypothetical protein
MQGQGSYKSDADGPLSMSAAGQDDRDDGMLLAMLVGSDHPGLWSVEELIHAMGDRVAVIDSLMRLEHDGLIHRLERFVFPTRAAVRAHELQL